MPRYRLRTLLILLAVLPPAIWWFGPRIREEVFEGWWTIFGETQTLSIDYDENITLNGKSSLIGKSYGRANPGDNVSLKTRGRVFVNGKLREPMER